MTLHCPPHVAQAPIPGRLSGDCASADIMENMNIGIRCTCNKNVAKIRPTVQAGMHFKGIQFWPSGGKPTKNALLYGLLLVRFLPDFYHM